jgi:hypothetical protein
MLVLAMQFSSVKPRGKPDHNGRAEPSTRDDSLKAEERTGPPESSPDTTCDQLDALAPPSMKPPMKRHEELLRKEVIQPHLPVRLPCYDFTPIADPTFDRSLPKRVRPRASGVANFRGVTGGVYKARERIHPGVADPGLLATPASRSRVADFDPN